MDYDLPFLCPILSPKYCLASTLCPCYLSSILYARIFKNRKFSVFGFVFVPFSAYGIRRYVQDKLQYEESSEMSAVKSVCCCNSLTQDLHEMKIRRIGVYKFLEEPMPCEDSDQVF